MKRRLLSALLALCMMLTMMPTVAFAVEYGPDDNLTFEMGAEVTLTGTEGTTSGWTYGAKNGYLDDGMVLTDGDDSTNQLTFRFDKAGMYTASHRYRTSDNPYAMLKSDYFEITVQNPNPTVADLEMYTDYTETDALPNDAASATFAYVLTYHGNGGFSGVDPSFGDEGTVAMEATLTAANEKVLLAPVDEVDLNLELPQGYYSLKYVNAAGSDAGKEVTSEETVYFQVTDFGAINVGTSGLASDGGKSTVNSENVPKYSTITLNSGVFADVAAEEPDPEPVPGPGGTAEVAVSRTAVLANAQQTADNVWSVASGSEYITLAVSETEPWTATVTGVAEGEATVSHTYTYDGTAYQETFTVTVTAAEEPEPEPEPPVVNWERSKSKTATNLEKQEDGTYTSDVTLSLPAADYERTIDVVFVIDDTHAGSGIFKMAVNGLLDELSAKQNLDIHVGVVAFDAVSRDWLSATSDGKYKGLASINDADALQALKNAIDTELGYNQDGYMKKVGGSNTEWPIAMAQEMLAEGTGSEKHVIMFSDMYGYVYRGSLKVDGVTYENVPLSKRINGQTQGFLTLAEPKYNTWDDVYANKAFGNETVDGFFRDSSWNDYWTIYKGLTPAPVNDISDRYNLGYGEDSVIGFEKSSCLTYDSILDLMQNDIQVTVVNNNFDPGSTAIQQIKNEMLDDLANKGVTLIREATANSAPFSSDQMKKVFATLEDKLIQVVDAGSKVIDEIGSGTDNHGKLYNFDFVDDAASLILTVGGNQYTATPVTEELDTGETARYNFTYKGVTATNGAAAPFVLHYYKDGTNVEGTTSGECFVWDINVPVTKEATVQLTYTVKLTNPQSEEGIYGQYDADGSEEYASLYTNNSATLYPVDSNHKAGKPEDFAKPTVSYTVGEIKIWPADITIYTGGEGYDSVVTGSGDSEVGTASNGLPEPGFYVELPTELNEFVIKNANSEDVKEVEITNEDGTVTKQKVVDLSDYLSFTYDDGNGNKRLWKLERYDKQTGNNSMAYSRYIYRILPSEVQGGEPIPIRLEFEAPDGKLTTSDDFTVDLDGLYQQYRMSIYAGALNQDIVKAQIELKGEFTYYDTVVDDGTLIVRGVTDQNTTTTEVAKGEAPANEVEDITAHVPEDTQFYINESQLEVAEPNAVRLLVDSIVPDDNNTLHNSAISEFDEITSSQNVQLNYLDLVDTSNGNAYVTTGEQEITVYWPYPEGTDKNDEFHIVHYEGLDRNDNNALEENRYTMTLYSAENENLENTDQGIKITVNSFSPFALFWEDDNGGGSTGGGGGGSNKPDDLNTEDHFAYIIGYPGGTVQPQGDITRAEVATIFFRMLTDEARAENWSQTNNYTDVVPADWYNNAISTLSGMGIISGYPDGSFRPNDPITRAEFTKIAVGFFEEAGNYVEGTFVDVPANAWYADFIDAAVDLGLIEGYPDGTIRPEATITRAEACTIVNRTLGRVPDKDHLLPEEDMVLWPDNSDVNAWYYAQMQEATNSHDYEWTGEGDEQVENWTEKLEDRDWDALETEWSEAGDAPGGEVMD